MRVSWFALNKMTVLRVWGHWKPWVRVTLPDRVPSVGAVRAWGQPWETMTFKEWGEKSATLQTGSGVGEAGE